ncbi:MAG: hypothetical protein KDD56_08470 [Bdellovibrionales bacterium]|nr:hypothetical protein [Bdellovibrionales bacterium]
MSQSQNIEIEINHQINQSIELLKSGQTEQALSLLNQARSHGLKVRDLEYVRALCFYELNDKVRALMSVQEEVRIFPENQNASQFCKEIELEAKPPSSNNPELRTENGAAEQAKTPTRVIETEQVLENLQNPFSSNTEKDLVSVFNVGLNEQPVRTLNNLAKMKISQNDKIAELIVSALSTPGFGQHPHEREFINASKTLVHESQDLFVKVYKRLANAPKIERTSSPYQGNSNENSQIERVVNDLNKNGVAFWRGLYADPNILNELRAATSTAVNKARQVMQNAECSKAEFQIPELGCISAGSQSPTVGRYRANLFPHSPPRNQALQQVMFDPRVAEIATRYTKGNVSLSYMLCELLEPVEKGDDWHIDSLKDDFKMMVILTDVTENHGPIRCLLETKDNIDLMGPVMHSTYTHGLNYAYPSYPLIRGVKNEVLFGTGKAGDAIFFDVGMIHSGTACKQDHRYTLVTRYSVDNVRNRVMTHLMD